MSDELFSYRLRRYREDHGLSQEQMGAALGVTARYIGMMERGDKDVEPNSALAKLFGLMEANKVRSDEFTVARSVNGLSLREEPRMPSNGAKVEPRVRLDPTQQRHALMLDRVREDTEAMIDGSPSQRRELAQLAKIHIDHFVTWLNASDE